MAWLGQQLELGADCREKDGRHRGKIVQWHVTGQDDWRIRVRWYDTGWITMFDSPGDLLPWATAE